MCARMWPLVCVCVTVFACVCPLSFLVFGACLLCVCVHVLPYRSPADHIQQPDNSACGWRWAWCRYVPGSAVWPVLQRPPYPQHGGGGAPTHQSQRQCTAGRRHAVLLHHPAVQCCSWRQPLRLCPFYQWHHNHHGHQQEAGLHAAGQSTATVFGLFLCVVMQSCSCM